MNFFLQAEFCANTGNSLWAMSRYREVPRALGSELGFLTDFARKSRSESDAVVRFSIKVSKVDQISAGRLYFSMLKLYVLPMATRSAVIMIDHSDQLIV